MRVFEKPEKAVSLAALKRVELKVRWWVFEKQEVFATQDSMLDMGSASDMFLSCRYLCPFNRKDTHGGGLGAIFVART